MSAFLQPMQLAAIFLLAPLAIIIGHRRPTGAIIVSGSVATVAAIVFWILLGSAFTPALISEGEASPVNPVVVVLLFYGGLLLLITAWTLALNSAASARHWGWVFLLVVGGYISFTALIINLSNPNGCTIGQVVTFLDTGLGCGEASPLVSLAFYTSHLVGPVVATLYGVLGTSRPHRHPLPPNVRVVPLGSSTEEDTEPGLL